MQTVDHETEWWSVKLPPGYAGEHRAGVYVVKTPDGAGVIELECIKINVGTTTKRDLKGHAGGNCRPCTVAHWRGFRSESVDVDRWALTSKRSNKVLLVRFRKNDATASADSMVDPVLEQVTLKQG